VQWSVWKRSQTLLTPQEIQAFDFHSRYFLRTLPTARIVVVFSSIYISDSHYPSCLTQVADLVVLRICLVMLLEGLDLVQVVLRPRSEGQTVRFLRYVLQHHPLRVHLLPVPQVHHNFSIYLFIYSIYTKLIMLTVRYWGQQFDQWFWPSGSNLFNFWCVLFISLVRIDANSCIGGSSRNLKQPNKCARSVNVHSDTSADEQDLASTSGGKPFSFSYFTCLQSLTNSNIFRDANTICKSPQVYCTWYPCIG